MNKVVNGVVFCETLITVKRTMYQRKVDVDMLNAVKSVLANVLSISPLSEQRRRANTRNVSQHTIYGIQHIHINLTLINSTFYFHTATDQKLVLTGTSIRPLYLITVL